MEKNESKPSVTEATGYAAGFGLSASRRVFRGKHFSAAIIVAVGAVLLLRGSAILHSDTQLFVQFVGCLVIAVGLFGWVLSSPDR